VQFNALSAANLKDLEAMVSKDRFSTGTSVLDLHAKDQSAHAACRPEAVIWPETAVEVSTILKYAGDHRVPVTGWGAGSSLEGNPIPVCRGIVLDFSCMNRILAIREEDFQADVQPGVVYQDLNDKLRHTGLFFPPDPGARATIGGMIANNASGTRTVLYGSTRDYVMRLVVALTNGELLELGTRASKSSSGYNLINLFVGSEAGGKAAAIAYTLIETAKLNDVDPEAWLADTIARTPDYRITKVNDLLPWNWKA